MIIEWLESIGREPLARHVDAWEAELGSRAFWATYAVTPEG